MTKDLNGAWLALGVAGAVAAGATLAHARPARPQGSAGRKSVGDFIDNGILRAQGHARAIAADQFITGMNPRYRGPKWKWEGFKSNVIKMAEASVYQNFSDAEWKAWENEIRDATKKAASHAADEVLESSGVLEWWSDAVDAAQRQAQVRRLTTLEAWASAPVR